MELCCLGIKLKAMAGHAGDATVSSDYVVMLIEGFWSLLHNEDDEDWQPVTGTSQSRGIRKPGALSQSCNHVQGGLDRQQESGNMKLARACEPACVQLALTPCYFAPPLACCLVLSSPRCL